MKWEGFIFGWAVTALVLMLLALLISIWLRYEQPRSTQGRTRQLTASSQRIPAGLCPEP
jgi:predicted MFS family arabinose efflux permease